MGRWEGRFADVPPNAVLSYQLEDGAAPVQIVAELSRPRYNEATSSIVFAAELVEYAPDALEGAEHPVEVPETVLPARAGAVLNDALKSAEHATRDQPKESAGSETEMAQGERRPNVNCTRMAHVQKEPREISPGNKKPPVSRGF